MRDLKNNIAIKQSMPMRDHPGNEAGAEVDRLGFQSVTFAIHVHSWIEAVHTLSVEHRDEDEDWSAVLADDLIGEMPVIQDDGASPSASDLVGQTLTVGYIGDKRYVRPKTAVAGISASPSVGATYGVDVILGHPHQAPTG